LKKKKKLPFFWFKKTFKVGQTAFSGNQGSCQSLAPNIDTLLGPNLTPVDPLGANFDDLYNWVYVHSILPALALMRGYKDTH
jgi:hypothetical protein